MQFLGNSLLLLLIIITACSAHGLKIRSRQDLTPQEARQVLLGLKGSRDKLLAVRLKADVKIDSRKKRFFFKELISAKRPDSIHLTTIKFGTPVVFISAKGDNMIAFDPNEDEFFLGRSDARLLKKLTGVELEVKDLFELIFGGIYVPDEFNVMKGELINERYYKIAIDSKERDGERRKFLIDGKNKIILSGEIFVGEGINAIILSLSKFRGVNEILYPLQLSLKRKEPYVEVVIKIKEARLGDQIEHCELEIVIPKGVTPLPFESLQELF